MTTATRLETIDPHAQQLAENLAVMFRRSGLKAKHAAIRVGMTDATISRRLRHHQPWLLWEVQALADLFLLDLTELTAQLPSREEWEERVRLKGFEPLAF